jgi:hypothetical protein
VLVLERLTLLAASSEEKDSSMKVIVMGERFDIRLAKFSAFSHILVRSP